MTLKLRNELQFFEKLLQKHSLDPAKTVMVGNDFYAEWALRLPAELPELT